MHVGRHKSTTPYLLNQSDRFPRNGVYMQQDSSVKPVISPDIWLSMDYVV